MLPYVFVTNKMKMNHVLDRELFYTTLLVQKELKTMEFVDKRTPTSILRLKSAVHLISDEKSCRMNNDNFNAVL